MLEAPVGLALFGPDLRFRWVNAALKRLGGQARADPSGPLDPSVPLAPDRSAPPDLSVPPCPDRSGPPDWAGLLPSEAWPEPIATRAEQALGYVLAKGAPLAEAGYPAIRPLPRGPGSCPARMCPPPLRTDNADANALDADARQADACQADAGQPGEAAAFLRLRFLVPGARRVRAGLRRRLDHAQHGRPVGRGRRGGRGRDQAQRGALPLAGPRRRSGGRVAAPDGAMKEDSPEWRLITGQSVEEYIGSGSLTPSTPRTASGSSVTGASASGPAGSSTTATGSAPRPGPRTGTMTSAPCRSSGTAGSSSGSGPAPTSPASARPRRCAAALPNSCPPRRCAPRGCSRPPRCWPRR